MASVFTSRNRLPAGAPLLVVVEGTTPELQARDWKIRIRSKVRPDKDKLVRPREVRRTSQNLTLVMNVPEMPVGLYGLTLLTPKPFAFDLPLLILDAKVLHDGSLYVSSEPFQDLLETADEVISNVRLAFWERTQEIALYDPDIYQAAAEFENILIDTLISDDLPASEIYWLTDTLADEYLYLAPLGILGAGFLMSRRLNRIEVSLSLTSAAGFQDVFDYLQGRQSELSLMSESGRLDSFRTSVEFVDSETLIIRAGFGLREPSDREEVVRVDSGRGTNIVVFAGRTE